MSLKETFNSIFAYKPENEYEFYIPENEGLKNIDNLNTKKEYIFNSLNKNLKMVQTSYNTLINSDIIIREFVINVGDFQYNAFLFYIDGMIDTNLMNDFILKPLMIFNKDLIYEIPINKFNLVDYLSSCLIPQNSIKKIDNFNEIFSGVNSGNCALFIDTLNIAFDIEVKGFKQRSIDSPNNEIVIKGSQEAFVENIRTNTSIIRRIINNEKLIIENIDVGKITKTKCDICYMQNITNSDLVAEVKYRINNLAIDSLISSRRIRTINF